VRPVAVLLTILNREERMPDNMRSSKPVVVDLFAGAGLFSHAFKREGFEVQRAIELDRVAAETYRANMGDHIEVGDVRKSRVDRECDVIIAGPPCQGFSTLGSMRRDDPRNTLAMQVVRFARASNASVVVVENVEAFQRSPVWQRMSQALQRLGYEVTSFTLNALDFGVPQGRVRSFTIASRKGLPQRPEPRGRAVRTVAHAFEGLSLTADGANHHYAPMPSVLALARIKLVPPGGDKRDILRRNAQLAPPSWTRLDHGGCEATDVWGRLEWGKPSNTLRTTLLNPSKGRYIHPSEHRVISLREAARLQSIPDAWTFAGRPYPIARQIGNSVPPRLGQAIARSVLQLLNP
jgi:DNA (cytosine-5)-methyltransferase 1